MQMQWKKIGKALLFPHIAIMIVLVPISTVLLVCSMILVGTSSAIAIISYVLSAYTLAVWCVRTPYLVRTVKHFKNENRYVLLWLGDERLRMRVSLYSSLCFNTAYAMLQLGIGFYHGSFWFHSLAIYYVSLAVMRFFLVRHTSRYARGERMLTELRKYRACGWIFLVLNLALSLMIFFMIYWGRTFHHSEITAIAMATYTFTAFTLAIINVFRYRRYKSPVYSAAKAISFAAACVSMLTLGSTMLTTFDRGTMSPVSRKLMLGAIGIAVSATILLMAVAMILRASKKIKVYKEHKPS